MQLEILLSKMLSGDVVLLSKDYILKKARTEISVKNLPKCTECGVNTFEGEISHQLMKNIVRCVCVDQIMLTSYTI